jgi:hypothetical protein
VGAQQKLHRRSHHHATCRGRFAPLRRPDAMVCRACRSL